MKFKTFSLILLTVAVLFGCGTAFDETGSVKLAIDNGIGSRLINPPISMEAFDYEVTISGNSPSVTVITEDTLFDGLIPGTYQISIVARNAAGDELGAGTAADVEVVVAHATEVNITVSEYTEVKGSLTGLISWEPDILTAPDVTGYLKDGSGTQTDLTFIVDPVACNATTAAADLNVGYLVLVNQVLDGDDLSAGFAEVVRIASGYETTYSKLLSVNQCYGGLDIIMNVELNNPLELGFDVPAGDVTVYTEEMPFTLTSVDEVGYIAVWYIDGSEVAVDADTYTVDPALFEADSVHRLDCIVFSTDGSRANSESWNLDFTGLTEYETTITFNAPEDGSAILYFIPAVGGESLVINIDAVTGFNEVVVPAVVDGEYLLRLVGPPSRSVFHFFDPDLGAWSLDEPTNNVLFPNYTFPVFDFGSF